MCLAVTLAGALVTGALSGGEALAQDAAKEPAKPAAAAPAKKEAAPAAAPAAKEAAPAKEGAAPAAPAKDAAAAPAAGDKSGEAKTAWYKMCARVPVKSKEKDKDGKDVVEEKVACTTFYESFNPATGAPLVYAALEESEGLEKKILTVVVPTGLALPPGMAVTTFQKEQWDKFVEAGKAGKTVKPEDVGLKALEMKYLHCHATGCASIIEVQQDWIDNMKTGVGLIVRAVEISNKVVDFPVPLKGFKEAVEGKPVDTQAFMAFRSERLKEMQQKRAELIEQYRKELAEKKAAGGAAAPAETGAAAKAPEKAAAAPAAKPAEKAAAPAPAPEKQPE